MANFDSVYTFIARDRFSGVATKITNKNTRLSRALKRMNLHLLGVRRNFDRVVRSAFSMKSAIAKLAALVGVGIVINKAATSVLNFEDAILDLSAITGAVGPDLSGLGDSAFKLGKDFDRSGADVLRAFKLVASAKPELLKNLPALKAVTKEVLTLAAASGLELAPASLVTAQALNIFNVGADQAARFVNVLGAGAKLGASEIEQTGQALLKAGPAAFAAGLSFEALNSAIQILAKGGIKAEMAGTGLNAMFIKMQAKGFDFGTESLGENFEELHKQVSRFNTVRGKTMFLTKLVGLENIKTVEGLILRRAELDKMTKSLTGTDIATEQATIRLSSFRTLLARTGTAFEEFSVRLSEVGPLDKILRGLVKDWRLFFESMSVTELRGINAALSATAFAVRGISESLQAAIKSMTAFLALLTKVGDVGAATAAEFTLGDKFAFKEEFEKIGLGKTLFEMRPTVMVTPPIALLRALIQSKTEVKITVVDPAKQVDKVESTTTPLAPVQQGFNQGTNMVPAT